MKLHQNKKINILHNIYSIDKSIGGPIFSMSVLAEAQIKLGHEVTVITGQSKNHINPVKLDEKVNLIRIPTITKYRYMKNWESNILDLKQLPDIIHTYGIWTYHNYIAYKFSLKFNIPHIIAPCGMLYEQGLKKSYFLKKIAWEFFQNEVLQNVSCFHAKSDQEVENIHSIFPNMDIEKIPNPLPTISKDQLSNENLSFEKYVKDKKILTFIGRLVKRKGIEDLINAWDRLVKNNMNWCLLIVGDDENKGYLKNIISQLESCNNINYLDLNNLKSLKNDPNLIITGSIYGKEKDLVYRKSDLFVNPSNFENFGMTIAEALNYNLPVIISKNTPWSLIEKNRCGWFLEKNNSNLLRILRKALNLSRLELKRMGKNSSSLTVEFDSMNIANKAVSLYLKYITRNRS